MPRLLLVSHTPSKNTRALHDAAVAGVQALPAITLRARDSLSADADDVRWCNGIIIGSTENFGAPAGLTKDFFERIYYPLLSETEGLPAAVYLRAGLDGQGSVVAIDRILTGLRWRMIQPTLVLHGDYQRSFEGQVLELAQTMAAGLEAGIF